MKARYIASALLLATSPVSAANTWWKATSDHFIVYSAGTKAQADDLAVRLERLDESLRYFLGVAPDKETQPESGKLTIYQFGDTDDIGRLAGANSVAGFFIPRAGDSVAFVPLKNLRSGGTVGDRPSWELDPSEVLFHEYTHYFMYQHAAASYPTWYSEGFAEFFGTLVLEPDGFRLGEPPKSRSLGLYYEGVDLDRLLAPTDEKSDDTVENIYGGGWLLTSYLSLDPSRAGQIKDYLARLNRGESSRDAARDAFGDLDKLKSDVDKYRRSRSRMVEVKFKNYHPPKATVVRVDDDAAAGMMLHIKVARGLTKKEAKRLVSDARKLATDYPQSGTALMTAASIEIDAGELSDAQSLGERAEAVLPDSVGPHLLLATVAMRQAKADVTKAQVARREFIAANHLDPKNPEALAGYYLTYLIAGAPAPASAKLALENAFEYAPFDDGIRQTLAYRLLLEKRSDETLAIMQPLVGGEHSTKSVKKFSDIVDLIKAGKTDEALAKLKPDFTDDDSDDGD